MGCSVHHGNARAGLAADAVAREAVRDAGKESDPESGPDAVSRTKAAGAATAAEPADRESEARNLLRMARLGGSEHSFAGGSHCA